MLMNHFKQVRGRALHTGDCVVQVISTYLVHGISVAVEECGFGREEHPDPSNPHHKWHWHFCLGLSAKVDIVRASSLNPIGASGQATTMLLN